MELTYENVPDGVDDIAWKSSMTSEEDEKRMRNLLKNIKPIKCFEYEGTIFKGDRLRATLDFVNRNTYPADFYVWLQNNYEIIK